jgi:hypothetical protein
MAKIYSVSIMDYEDDTIELRRRFMNYLFDETKGDEYKSVSFNLVDNKACAGVSPLEIYDNNNDPLKTSLNKI